MTDADEIDVLSPAQAYALWAPAYESETGVSLLDEILVGRLTPPLTGKRLLDVGCGTGRRMRNAGAASAVGVEPSAEMIAAGAAALAASRNVTVLQGDAGNLPVRDCAFDVIWCRLVLGHVAGLQAPYAEMARALSDGGTAIVSDFHADAYAQGHRRTFRDGARVWEIETYPHTVSDHIAAAKAVGLTFAEQQEAAIGPDIRRLYAEADRLALYEQHRGLPLVFALRFART